MKKHFFNSKDIIIWNVYHFSLKNIVITSNIRLISKSDLNSYSLLSNMATKFNIRAIAIFVFISGRRKQIHIFVIYAHIRSVSDLFTFLVWAEEPLSMNLRSILWTKLGLGSFKPIQVINGLCLNKSRVEPSHSLTVGLLNSKIDGVFLWALELYEQKWIRVYMDEIIRKKGKIICLMMKCIWTKAAWTQDFT